MSDKATTEHYTKFISNAIGFMEKQDSTAEWVTQWKKNTPEEKLKDLFEMFQKVPGWEKFPMPENFYKYFNVKKPKPDDSPAVMSKDIFMGGERREIEYREAAAGGVREVIFPEPLKVETEFIPDEIVSDTKQDFLEEKCDPPKAASS